MTIGFQRKTIYSGLVQIKISEHTTQLILGRWSLAVEVYSYQMKRTYWLRTSLRTTKIWREKKEKPTLPMNNNFCSDIWIRIWRKQTERPSNHVSTVKNAVCGVMIYIFLVYIRKLLPIDYHVKTSSYIASVGEYVFTLWLQYSHNQRISNWTDTYGMWWKGWSASWNGCRPM